MAGPDDLLLGGGMGIPLDEAIKIGEFQAMQEQQQEQQWDYAYSANLDEQGLKARRKQNKDRLLHAHANLTIAEEDDLVADLHWKVQTGMYGNKKAMQEDLVWEDSDDESDEYDSSMDEVNGGIHFSEAKPSPTSEAQPSPTDIGRNFLSAVDQAFLVRVVCRGIEHEERLLEATIQGWQNEDTSLAASMIATVKGTISDKEMAVPDVQLWGSRSAKAALTDQMAATNLTVSEYMATIRMAEEAAEALIMDLRPMVNHVAVPRHWRVRQMVGGHVTLQDVKQWGSEGVMKAIHKYKPEKGAAFASYAFLWIKATIDNQINQLSPGLAAKIPAAMKRDLGRIWAEMGRYADENMGQEPSHAYLAEKLDMPLEKVEDLISKQRLALPTSSLNAVVKSMTKNIEDPPELIDTITSSGTNAWDLTGSMSVASPMMSKPGYPALAFAEAHQLRALVQKHLDELSLVDRTLVVEKFGLHGASWSGTTEESAMMARRHFSTAVLGKPKFMRGSLKFGAWKHVAMAAEVSTNVARSRYPKALEKLKEGFEPFEDEFSHLGHMPIAEDAGSLNYCQWETDFFKYIALAFAEAHQLRALVQKHLDELSLVDRTLVVEKFGLHGASWSGTTEESALMARRYFTATVLEGGPAGKAGSKRGSGLYGSLTHMARAAEVSKFLAKARYQTAMDDLRDYFVPFADEFELIGRMPIAEDCW
eukprot:CAMPEP_0113953362 /NCGR_PEP_ID=MMETSP1339-20121228/90932_1 /TAXON_ID=94617 /ORGANISM="Fibrocapsa japonica" /LENGTH=704 /DNA_ID=CAMNT_0000962085 /DNA_START=301 /DNA_END=2416 /DNA_ORIENTATION=- /assembly_acc=CAM_ASM_000762